MSIVSVKDFGIALNIKAGTIRSKLSRGQLLRNKNKLIDTENATNFGYLLEVNGGDQSVFDDYAIKPIGRTNVDKKVSPPNKKQTKVPISENKIDSEVLESKKIKENVPEKRIRLSSKEIQEREEQKRLNQELKDYETRKKRADAEYRERESELKKMQLEKIAGNTLPLDLVKKIVTINCQAILIQFMSSIENMVSVTVEELGGNRADNVRIMNRLKVEFKKVVDNCGQNAGREIENAVSEYSEVRSRGERR
jgi:hypothetical protein